MFTLYVKPLLTRTKLSSIFVGNIIPLIFPTKMKPHGHGIAFKSFHKAAVNTNAYLS